MPYFPFAPSQEWLPTYTCENCTNPTVANWTVTFSDSELNYPQGCFYYGAGGRLLASQVGRLSAKTMFKFLLTMTSDSHSLDHSICSSPIRSSLYFLDQQICGILSIFAWVSANMIPFFYVFKMFGMLRISAEEEQAGLDASKHGGSAYNYDGGVKANKEQTPQGL